MKKFYILILIMVFAAACRQEMPPARIAFYNVENLFDLEDDPATSDEEFAIGGTKNVTREILDLKLKKLSEVLTDLDADLLGLCEVENWAVLDMLNDTYTVRDYSIIHFDSPDERGIDNAFLYDPAVFTVLESEPVRILLPDSSDTRDILYVKGKLGGEVLHIFVNHWPSHWGGTEKTIPLRAATARQLRERVETILGDDPGANILVMGDLNDDPEQPSIVEHLGATMDREQVGQGRFILWNLMKDIYTPPGKGTYRFRGKATVLDHMLISPGLFDGKKLDMAPGSMGVLDQPKYRQQDGDFRDYPFRFWAGNRLLGGYSDHLAVFLMVERK